MSKKTTPPPVPMRASYQIVIPGLWPKGPNALNGKHYRTHQRHRRAVHDRVRHAICSEAPCWPHFLGPVEVSVTRWWGPKQRALDPDNLVAATKPIIDALHQEPVSMFEGDSQSTLVQLVVRQAKHPYPGAPEETRIVVAGEVAASDAIVVRDIGNPVARARLQVLHVATSPSVHVR